MCNCTESSAFPFSSYQTTQTLTPSSSPLDQAERLPPLLSAVPAGWRTPSPQGLVFGSTLRPPERIRASLFGYIVELLTVRLGLLQH
jgi:hypothetical protein